MEKTSIIQVKSVEQLKELVAVFAAAFEEEYNVSDEQLNNILKNEPALTLAATIDSKIVGGIMAFVLTPLSGEKELYIYDLAVDPNFQKQGIGKQLIQNLQQVAKNLGASTIFVDAESEDHGAVAFYKAVGGIEVKVNHFTFSNL